MYEPFKNRAADELEATDLECLAEVPEGWFVEFKRDPDSPKDYAKEATAFANSRGGWIFVGLEEDKATRKPNRNGPGIPNAQGPAATDSARDGILQHSSPSPSAEFKFVRGPIASLGVPDGHGVLVIRIPESRNTPHIHTSGKVYMRNADAATPINGRSEIDELYRRREALRALIDQGLNIGFDEQWAKEVPAPWIHIALVPKSDRSSQHLQPTIEEFRRTVAQIDRSSGGIILDDIHASSLGFVATNLRRQDSASGAASTLEYSHSGSFYVTLPQSWASSADSSSVPFLQTQMGSEFCTLLQDRRMDEFPIVDLTSTAASVYGMSVHIENLAKQLGRDTPYAFRMKVRNMFRCVTFVESKTYISWCKTHAIPISHRGAFDHPWPSGHHITVDHLKNEILQNVTIPLFNAFGIGNDILAEVAHDALAAAFSKKKVT